MSCVNHSLKSIFIHIAKCGGSTLSSLKWNKGNGHKTYSNYYGELGNSIEKYFVWTFVRNPWSRSVSAFEDCPELHKYVPDFQSFINILYKNKNLFHEKRFIRDSGLAIPEIPISRIHFWPAHLCTQNEDGAIKCDFVGKLENFDDDLKKICKHLNVEFNLPKIKNKREGKPLRKNTFYKDLYNDSLINQVGEIYKKDISLFNYQY